MKKYNLKDLWKASKERGVPLLGNRVSLRSYSFMDGYADDYVKYDRLIGKTKGFLQPIWNTNEEDTLDDVLDEFRIDAEYIIEKNKVNYQKLYNLTLATYNPLENYSMTESGTDITNGVNLSNTTFGEKTTTNVMGSKTTTNNVGERVTTDDFGNTSITNIVGGETDSTTYGAKNTDTTFGAVSTDTEYGERSRTDTIGAESNITENEVAAFNSANYEDSNKSTTTIAAKTNGSEEATHTDTVSTSTHTDSISEDQHTDTLTKSGREDSSTMTGHTDTHTVDEATDSIVEGAHTDSLNEAEHSDSTSDTTNSTTTHNFTRSGNIGVTTSQQMAQSEIDLWLNYKFFDVVVNDILSELCTYVDEGGNCYGI